MTTLPYPIQVTLTGSNVSNVIVTVVNTTNDTYTNAKTNEDGLALLDLANAGSWVTTDIIRIWVKDSGQYAYESFTIGDTDSYSSTLTLASLDRSTALTDLWDVMYEHLQTGQYAISTDNIFSAMNDDLASSTGYPRVIIYVPKFSSKDLTVGGGLYTYDVNYFIEIYTNSSATCKALADEVTYAIQNGRAVFNNYQLKRMEMPSADYDFYTEGKKKIHVMAISVNFVWVVS